VRAWSSCGSTYSCTSPPQVVLDDGADITVSVGEPVGCNAPSVPARLRGWLEALRDGGRDARTIHGVQEALKRRRFNEPVVNKLPPVSFALPLDRASAVFAQFRGRSLHHVHVQLQCHEDYVCHIALFTIQ